MAFNDRLFTLLSALSDDELRRLWTECLRCKPEEDDFLSGSRDWRIACISKAWRAVHGHTLRNLARSPHELPWKRILIDVADRLEPGLGWTAYRLNDAHTEEEIEAAILRQYDTRVGPVWKSLTPEARLKVAAGGALPNASGAKGAISSLAGSVTSIAHGKTISATLTLLSLHELRRLIAHSTD